VSVGQVSDVVFQFCRTQNIALRPRRKSSQWITAEVLRYQSPEMLIVSSN